jgi:DNA-binding NarL/FixJ family response regulator
VTDPVRILLVDDHAVLRSGLRLLLEREDGLEPVGEADTAEDAVRSLPRLRPDVVVIDVEMPGMGGIDGASRIKERAPEARILVLSMHDRAQDVRRAFDAGADGYRRRRRPTRTSSAPSGRWRRASATFTPRWARRSPRPRRRPARSTS